MVKKTLWLDLPLPWWTLCISDTINDHILPISLSLHTYEVRWFHACCLLPVDRLIDWLVLEALLVWVPQVEHIMINCSSPQYPWLYLVLFHIKHNLSDLNILYVAMLDLISLTVWSIFRFAAEKRQGTDYFILLIITDGIITDMPQTKAAIVYVSPIDYPRPTHLVQKCVMAFLFSICLIYKLFDWVCWWLLLLIKHNWP